MESLRIVQIGPTRYKGGVAMAIQDLVYGLAEHGHKVTLIGNGGVDSGELNRHGIAYVEAPLFSRPWCLFKTSRIISQVLRHTRADVLHSHSRSASLASVLAGRRPDWFTFHNSFLTDKVGLLDFGPIRKYCSPLGGGIFCLNPEARDYLATQLAVNRERVVINPNGVDLGRFRPPTQEECESARQRFGVAKDDLMALFVGRFHAQKQPQAIITLADRARQRHINQVKFVMVGEGPMQEDLEQKIVSKGLSDTVQLKSWMDPVEAYWAADVLFMPSLYEGLGLVAGEAIACGCPVLRTRTGGAEYTVEHGVSGFVCDSDEESFVVAALNLLESPQLLSNLKEQTRPWAESHLRKDKYIERAAKAYLSRLCIE